LHRAERVEVLARHRFDRDVVDIQLILAQ
jgi:hypothetical protein